MTKNSQDPKCPFRIRYEDGFGNISYLSRGDYDANTISYRSSTEVPLALSNMVQGEAAVLRMALNDAKTPEEALVATRAAWQRAFRNTSVRASECITLIETGK